MATSAFKSTTRRAPVGDSSPSTVDTPASSSSKAHRRSRSLSRFSRPIPAEFEPAIVPTPRRKFVSTVRGSDFPEISLDDLAIEFFSGKDNSSELDDESVSSRSSRFVRTKPEISPPSSHRRSRSVSRNPNGANSANAQTGSATGSNQRRGRSVSRRNDGNGTGSNVGGTIRVVPNADSRRRRSVSVARCQISDSESQSSALTDDDLRYGRYGRNEIEKTIRAAYAQKKIDHPTGDDANLGLCEAMKKELKSAVNEIMIELEQTMERKPSALSVHDRLYANKTDAATRKSYTIKLKQLKEQRVQDGFKIVREVIPESKVNANAQKVSHSRKRSNDKNRVSKRLNEEAEKYFEDFISNVEDTDFSSFDGERSDTSSSLVGTTIKQGAQNVPVEMEGINLPWLKWDENDGVLPIAPKTKLWDPSQDLRIIQEHGNRSNSSHGSWDPEHITASSTNIKGNNNNKENKSPGYDMVKYIELKRTEEALFDSWRERSVISSGGLLLCSALAPF